MVISLGSTLSTNDIILLKDTSHRFIGVSDGYLDYFNIENSRKILGLNDFTVIESVTKNKVCSSDSIVEDFLRTDEKAFLGENLYILELFPILGHFYYHLTHKSPYYEDGKLKGVKVNILHLGALNKGEVNVFLKNKNVYLSQHTKLLMEKAFKNNNVYGLTPREMDCIHWLMKGQTAKEVGKSLNISYRTVEIHIEHIKYKLNVKTLKTLVAKLYEENFR